MGQCAVKLSGSVEILRPRSPPSSGKQDGQLRQASWQKAEGDRKRVSHICIRRDHWVSQSDKQTLSKGYKRRAPHTYVLSCRGACPPACPSAPKAATAE